MITCCPVGTTAPAKLVNPTRLEFIVQVYWLVPGGTVKSHENPLALTYPDVNQTGLALGGELICVHKGLFIPPIVTGGFAVKLAGTE